MDTEGGTNDSSQNSDGGHENKLPPPLLKKRRLFVGERCSRCEVISESSSDDGNEDLLENRSGSQSSLSCDEPLLPIEKDTTGLEESSEPTILFCDEGLTQTNTTSAPIAGSYRLVKNGWDILYDGHNRSQPFSPCLAKSRRNSLRKTAIADKGLPAARTAEHYTADERIFLRDPSDVGQDESLYIVDIHLRAWPSEIDKQGWQRFLLPIFSHLSPADYLAFLSFACWAPDRQPRFDFDMTYLQSAKCEDVNYVSAKFDCSDELLLRWRPRKQHIVQVPYTDKPEPHLFIPRSDDVQVHLLCKKGIDTDEPIRDPFSLSNSTQNRGSVLRRASEWQIEALSTKSEEESLRSNHKSEALDVLRIADPEPPDSTRAAPFWDSDFTKALSRLFRLKEFVITHRESERKATISWTDIAVAMGADDIDRRCRGIKPFGSRQWLFLFRLEHCWPMQIFIRVLSLVIWMITSVLRFVRRWWWMYPIIVILGIHYLIAMSRLGTLLGLGEIDPVGFGRRTFTSFGANHSFINAQLALPNNAPPWQRDTQMPSWSDQDTSQGDEARSHGDDARKVKQHDTVAYNIGPQSLHVDRPWPCRLRDAIDRSLGWSGEGSYRA